MPDIVVSVLQQMGPCISSDLVAVLVKDHKLTQVAARQRVSRSTAIKKLAHLTFPRRARFVYLQSDYASPQFWDSLVRDLLKHTICYGGGLAALMARGGVMPVAHFAIACGAPVAQKRHVSAAAVLKRLLARLMLPAHAEALLQNVPIAESIGQILSVWQVSLGPLRGRRFVGGFPCAEGA